MDRKTDLVYVYDTAFSRNGKEMFYLTTHSSHFIYGYMASDIIMVKDHSNSDRGNQLPPHGLLFPISSNGLCYTSRGALAETRKNLNGPP